MTVKQLLNGVVGLLAMVFLLPVAAWAQEEAVSQDNGFEQGVFFFGGRLHDGNIGDNFAPFGVSFEDNFIVGGGFDRDVWSQTNGLAIGVEIGTALRFGESASIELWGGPYLRYDGLIVSDALRISPKIVGGISLVSDTIGSEAERAENTTDTDGRVLFYLTPEISISSLHRPELEYFWRGQHRSGGYGTLGSMFGANAVTFGMRYKF
ncbi:hypothetical protein [Pelagibacterium lentulum]|uniref:Outer membrane protein beta-barrel domain-containing protein n=1 Tax=Pelagibacterium lentulum TaxID=2029865 RepID=A0A916R857_9HYPH|nr:hypothetical protein [Pelagibacterium lentulum]GGA37192.1 hypothetical protein GCM10011499_03190 [Pelagibacterium lentulum]